MLITHLNPDEDILYFNERFAQKNEVQVMFAEVDPENSNTHILNAIKQLKSGKSSGLDHMLNDLFVVKRNDKLFICYF